MEFVSSMSLRDWRDWGGVIRLGGSTDAPSEFANGDVRMKNPVKVLCDRVSKALGWDFVTPWPAFQQISPRWELYGLGRRSD